ncbi:MAG: alpha-L-fucosidase [Alistipes sp.]|nr:alpha-L-fucosidase [Alistipes sp.]
MVRLKFPLLILALTSIISCSVDAPRAMNIVPSQRQLEWHEMEQYAFVHFTINTFTDREWGFGDESPTLFNPTDFDADALVEVVKNANLKGLILTAKHHDGFCLWPTKYTEHSIKYSPYKGGEGDIVGEVAEACRRHGIKFGIYLSPWDRNHAGYGSQEYLHYYRNQVGELLSNYGPVFEMWFDGANGGDGYYGGAYETRWVESGYLYYDWPKVIDIIRELSPDTIVWSSSQPDARWCGNEKGVIDEHCWAMATPEDMYPNGRDSLPVLIHGQEDGSRWTPAEADVSIRPGWFYHDHERPKTPEELFRIYLTSVGRGGTLLLNLAPDRRGRIPEEDIASIMAWREMLDASFKNDLALKASFKASSSRGRNFGVEAMQGDDSLYWATKDGVTSGDVYLEWDVPITAKYIVIEEHIALGQRVREFVIDVKQDNKWHQVSAGTTIGYKRIIPLEQEIITNEIRIRFIDARGPLTIARIAVY